MLSFSAIVEILGIIAFTISGTVSALHKKLDLFGVHIIGFITAIGGGTIRDILIGATPVSWMRDINTPVIILVTCVITIWLRHYVHYLKTTLLLFDALGLGLFAVIGIKKGLDAGLHPAICIALGTITGCFGGVLRDTLLKEIPVLFQKEIYATACIIGGLAYLACLQVVSVPVAESIAVIVVCSIRILAVKYQWKLPSL
ncbi:trimeric intracellular cation channel family protein [Mucilaginibacter hurinus]|uniref:Trimeric intracellular cation channel family protein n=1 Tax=Mucilaginibacter hurinus TaxID=2201324 RepID=A0A367GSE6_9SPHI|nr:trimeric intracellular cation channel family protein [Mucilaginibacter hurinus]RCH56354.1 trimeric intracellular cation channel family protein [Mucilaginibacter hurinus]